MEWLGQNWIWIVFGIAALGLMMRGCGTGHSFRHRDYNEERNMAPPAIGNRPGNLFDPVSGRSFAAGNAPISNVYRGRAYYFESRENRDAFEADPEKFLAADASVGERLGSERDAEQRRRHHHGC